MKPRTRVVICDYGGVLTNPLAETVAAFASGIGVEPADIPAALGDVGRDWGEAPMARLETARTTEADFLAAVEKALARRTGRPVRIEHFRDRWFAGRTVNEPMCDYLRQLRARGLRTALLTNNVAEWRDWWAADLPLAELFELVVDSSAEGVRKPDPEIYRRTLERLGVRAEECLFIDDLEDNRATAEALGMRTVPYLDVDQVRRAAESILESEPQ